MRQKHRIMCGAFALVLLLALGIFFGARYYRQLQEQKVMAGFEALLGQESLTVNRLQKYVDKNLNAVSPENAALLVSGIERVQIANLPQWEQKYVPEVVQRQLAQAFQDNGWVLPNPDNIQDEALQALLRTTAVEGYKVETAEGFFFPVADYAFYDQYLNKVSANLAAYFAIMKTESDQMPAKDAALIIGWDEVLQRAARQEQFLNQYAATGTKTAAPARTQTQVRAQAQTEAQVETVRALLERYVMFTLFGLNNTPLFNYEDGRMVAEARQAYQEFSDGADSAVGGGAGNAGDADSAAGAPRFTNLMREYLALLAENDYQLTTAVNEYRQNAAATY